MPRVAALALLLLAGSGAAQAPGSVELRGPQPQTVKLGDAALLQVVYHGRAGELLAPEAVPGLRFRVGGPSSQFTSINGVESHSISWTIEATPTRAGTFPIPALRVRVGGETKSTPASQLVCVEDLTGKDHAFVEAGFLPEKVFLHQPADAWIRIGVDTALLERLERGRNPPNVFALLVGADWFDEFPAGVPLGKRPDEPPRDVPIVFVNRDWRVAADLGRVARSGSTFQVFEVRRRFLPNKAGGFALDAPSLQFTWVKRYGRDLFGELQPLEQERVFARGEPRTIEVLPLPEEGRPADFRDAVGSFRVSAALAKRSVKVGESVKLTLGIEGDGNVEFLEVPKFDGGAGFHLFGRTIERGEDRVTVTYDIAALDDSQRQVVPPSFSWFDPAAQPPGYRRAGLAAIPIEVSALPAGTGLAPLPETKRDLTPGVDDIWDRMDVSGPPPTSLRPSSAMVGLILLVPLLLFAIGWGIAVRRAYLRANPQVLRQRRAREGFRSRLPEAGPLRAFSLYLAERFGWDEGAAVRADLAARLRDAGVPAELAERSDALLRELQRGRYASRGDEATLAQAAMTLVQALEQEVPR